MNDIPSLVMDFIEDRIARGYTPATIVGYKNRLAYFLDWLGDRPLTRATVRAYLADLQQRDLAATTVKQYFAYLQTFCLWLMNEGYLTENPCRNLMPKTPKVTAASYNTEQIHRLLDVCDLRDRAILIFLLDTGLRRSELLSLRQTQIGLDGRFTVMGKGRKERSGQLSPYALYTLWAYLGTRTDSHPALWYGPQGALTPHGLYERIKELCKRAGIQSDVRRLIHSFRATFAKNYVRRGGDLESLRQLLGHENIKMSAYYAQLAGADANARKRDVNPLAAMIEEA